jgi:hypothetical protein
MAESPILDHIDALVGEEHRLWAESEQGRLDDQGHARLEAIRGELDRCWDLLRQRRSREQYGLDPDEASPRDADTVEGYEQ